MVCYMDNNEYGAAVIMDSKINNWFICPKEENYPSCDYFSGIINSNSRRQALTIQLLNGTSYESQCYILEYPNGCIENNKLFSYGG